MEVAGYIGLERRAVRVMMRGTAVMVVGRSVSLSRVSRRSGHGEVRPSAVGSECAQSSESAGHLSVASVPPLSEHSVPQVSPLS